MKGLITIRGILCLLFTSVYAIGFGSFSSNLSRKSREFEAFKKRQNEHFEKMQREAQRLLRDMRGQDGPVESKPCPACRPCP